MTSTQSAVQPKVALPIAGGQLYVLLYRSHSLIAPERVEQDLAQILKGARAKNASLGVTGALMLYDDWFAQVLEGPEAAVTTLFATIRADKRHNGVEVIEQGGAKARAFERWAMAHVGEHGEPDIPIMASGGGLAPGAAWKPSEEQEAKLVQLRQATRGYGRGA